MFLKPFHHFAIGLPFWPHFNAKREVGSHPTAGLEPVKLNLAAFGESVVGSSIFSNSPSLFTSKWSKNFWHWRKPAKKNEKHYLTSECGSLHPFSGQNVQPAIFTIIPNFLSGRKVIWKDILAILCAQKVLTYQHFIFSNYEQAMLAKLVAQPVRLFLGIFILTTIFFN